MSGHRFTAALPVLGVVLLGALPLRAQSPQAPVQTEVPRLIRVTGFLHLADGQPAAPTERATFSIYSAETGGAPLWQETQDLVVGANGQYSVLLGASQAAGLPIDLFASGDARWLAVQIERTGESEQPRTLLASVAYALRASDVERLGGKPSSAYVLAPAPDEIRPVTVVAGSSDVDDGGVVPGGALNALAKYQDTNIVSASSAFEVAGRMGIGTNAPVDALHVRFTNLNGAFTGIAVQNLGASTAAYSGMLFYDQNGQLGQFQGFNNVTHEYRINNIVGGGTINFMTNSVSRLLVASSGNIGIGRPVPASPLDVGGDVNLSGLVRQTTAPWLHKRGFGNVVMGIQSLNAPGGSATNVGLGDDTMPSINAGAGANVAVGRLSLFAGTDTSTNTAVGLEAMRDGTGAANVMLGPLSGASQTTGTLNMFLGYRTGDNPGNVESSTMRIGDSGSYGRFFVGAVRGVTTGHADGIGVVIDSNGQLGFVSSSARYKEDIHDMGDASDGLMKLRPVTFRYTQPYADGSKPIDYGLIAEEVEEVYPDLVAHLADGQVETVQYHKINVLMLNEVQKQQRQLDAQHADIELLKARLAALEAQRR